MTRGGFTLFELMLVMMIALVALAISIPAIDAMMDDGNVKAARDVVRARLADARGRAMQEGRPYKFSVNYQTNKFRVEPEDPNTVSDTGDAALVVEDELPSKIPFARSANSPASTGGGSDGYEVEVVYLPNGTARDDWEVQIGTLGLRVRGLTGAVTTFDKLQDMQQQ
jgi:prepilin-type N-terminal cleavage/methylation domain-containing protein